MTRLKAAVLAFFVFAAPAMFAGEAAAATVIGYTTTALKLRAGPGTGYPVVATMPARDRVTVYGCLSGWSWCDVGWRGHRGWASGRYIEAPYQQRRRPITTYGDRLGLPFLSFSIGVYWNQHYRHHSFYNHIRRYPDRVGPRKPGVKVERPRVHAPRPPRPEVQQPRVREPWAQQPRGQQPRLQQPWPRQPKPQQPRRQSREARQPQVQKPWAPQRQVQQPGPRPSGPNGKKRICPPGQNCQQQP